jgi:hypothetical protein
MPKPKKSRFHGYWTRRVRSPGFRRELAAMLAGELRSLAQKKVGAVVDAKRVRRRIERREGRAIDQRVLAELIGEVGDAVVRELRKTHRSARDLMDDDVAGVVDALLEEAPILAHAEELITKVMQQELVRDVLTDVIHSSIVSFNERINPLFGGMAMMMLERQIKSFIGLFLPMVLEQATAFVIDRRNRELFADFARAIVRGLLEEPLPRLFPPPSTGSTKKSPDLVGALMRSPELGTLDRQMKLAVWNAVFARLRNRKVGDVLLLEENADRMAADAVELLLPFLLQPSVVGFLERELLLATGAT